ncbi:MAG: DUF1854 domain-containing protein [Ruminococcaceae bacterium]|nr:DUF1854 domain-containing protein [Oscillospiraceae bacterium]
MGRIYVDRYTGKLERTDIYHVRLTLKDGTVIEDLEPRRLFPVTNSTMFITLLDRDEHEIAFIRDLTEIDEASKQALLECFNEYYMIPAITAVLECTEKFGSLKWTVETDRGVVSFRIRNRHSDIKNLYGTTRILVRDSNDNRYEIRDYTALDSHSQRLLFSYL